MLNNITWGNYASIVLLLLLVYYIIIGAKFYSQEVKDVLAGKQKFAFRSVAADSNAQEEEILNNEALSAQPELFTSEKTYVPDSDEGEDIVRQVQVLTRSIKEVIAEAVEKKYIKEEFFLALQLLVKKYSFLKCSLAVEAIDNLIASECEKYGYIQLNAEERVMLWNE